MTEKEQKYLVQLHLPVSERYRESMRGWEYLCRCKTPKKAAKISLKFLHLQTQLMFTLGEDTTLAEAINWIESELQTGGADLGSSYLFLVTEKYIRSKAKELVQYL